MKRIILILILFLFPCEARAQNTISGTGGITTGTVLPATCSPGDVFNIVSIPAFNICSSDGVWVNMFPAAVVISGPTLPATCIIGAMFTVTPAGTFYTCSTLNNWTIVGGNSSSGVPQGAIIFVATGTCPVTYTEVSGLNGHMFRGTVAANGNVGNTGGNDSVTPTFTGNSIVSSAVSAGTPAGTNSTLSFTGEAWTPPVISWPVGVPIFTGNSIISSAVSGGTPAGTNGTGTVTPLGNITNGTFTNAATATTGNCAATNVAIGTGATNACKATAPNLTVPTHGHTGTLTWTGSSSVTSAEVFTGSALATHTHTTTATGSIVWPVGVPTIATYTPTGTINTPVFTGTALGTHTHTTTATGTISAIDTKASYINLIGCSKD